MFIDGLDSVIRSFLTRYRKEKQRTTHLNILQRVRVKEDAIRAPTHNNRSKPAESLLMESRFS